MHIDDVSLVDVVVFDEAVLARGRVFVGQACVPIQMRCGVVCERDRVGGVFVLVDGFFVWVFFIFGVCFFVVFLKFFEVLWCFFVREIEIFIVGLLLVFVIVVDGGRVFKIEIGVGSKNVVVDVVVCYGVIDVLVVINVIVVVTNHVVVVVW